MSIQGVDNENLLNINLLPEEFIRERIRRRNNRQQRRTAILFLLIVGICSWQHFERSRLLQIERDHTVQSVGQITSQLQSPVGSRAELDALEAKASLITFLRVRGLPTQVFHMLDETRPDDVILSTLKLSRTTARTPPPGLPATFLQLPRRPPLPEASNRISPNSNVKPANIDRSCVSKVMPPTTSPSHAFSENFAAILSAKR